jgi:enoyl-CoA hydratase
MTDAYAKYQTLKIDRPSEGVLRIAFNRPERMNALTSDGHRELVEIWRDVDRDRSVSAALLCGIGKDFSAGGEFSLVEEMISDAEVRHRTWREARELVHNIIECSKPIVSAIQGAAAGGGLAAGLLADISIVAKTARLVDGHVRLGVCAGDHAALLWPLLCGLAKAKYHLLLNEQVTGEEAERIGLVSLAVDESELQDKALSIAQRLAKGAPTAIRWTKHSLNNWLRAAAPTFEASLALEMLGFGAADVKEGVASFREKRPPNFNQDTAV